MRTLQRWYWTARLLGHRVDTARGIIGRHKNWRFIVDYQYPKKNCVTARTKKRVHLHTEKSGRILRVDIA